MKNILITFSGGRTSAFMAVFCKERYKNDNLLFVFVNTGKERSETLDFVNQCDKYFNLNLVWLEADITNHIPADQLKYNIFQQRLLPVETEEQTIENQVYDIIY
ncbi:phosphoadenosine phosphosulfate reductase domain-containing protein [Capnocytophaga canimorsus]|uniref:phosphoadenosine phosphosulfate reductase domain-containing protein n=1 Tax=Capnocytophaga canimorsus TaxID=28188 RepID=UPI001EDF1D20|nr:phosphoadenosine phosphosulfate reductase family protein [Capnocytophaga canimorsus]GJQ04626.1 hypothetical protein CAPN009_10410 [Capnocytophaga canimorsus]